MLARLVMVGLVFFAAAASPVRAQNFQGRGAESTESFSLSEGLAVFEVEYKGDGEFLVTLVDDRGVVVGELARASGAFSGSKELRIDRTGEYRIDVAATGQWSARLRRNEVAAVDTPERPENEQARAAGMQEASRVSTTGWLARGFLGGVLLGPIGTGVAMAKAGSSAEVSAAQAAQSQPAGNPAYALTWQEAYLDRLRTRRQRSALLGGAVGTGVLLIALLQVVDLGGVTDDDTVGQPSFPIVIPIRW
jgi:hypothetical protein